MGILDFLKKKKQSSDFEVIVNGKKYKTSIDCSDEAVEQRKRAATPDKEGRRRVDIKSFFDKYIQYDCIPDDLCDNLQHRFIQGFSYADIPEGQIKLVEGRYERRKAENERLGRCAALNNEGIQYEKQGEIDKAINVYEQNIADGYPATHSYERLMILYRKRKEYDKEISVAKRAIEVFGRENKKRAKKAITEYPTKKAEIESALESCTVVRGDMKNLSGALMVCFAPYDVNKYRRRLEKASLLNAKSQAKIR